MSRWFTPIAFAVLLVGLGGCVGPQKVQAPTIALQNVVFQKSQGFMQHLEVQLIVSNPNDFSIPLTGLKFDLKVNGLDFAQGLSNQHVEIPRLGRAVVPVDVTVSVLALMKQIQAAQKRKDLEYRVKGTAFLDQVLLPKIDFDRQGKIKLNLEGGRNGFKVM